MYHQELFMMHISYQCNFTKAKNLGFLLEAFTLTTDTSVSFPSCLLRFFPGAMGHVKIWMRRKCASFIKQEKDCERKPGVPSQNQPKTLAAEAFSERVCRHEAPQSSPLKLPAHSSCSVGSGIHVPKFEDRCLCQALSVSGIFAQLFPQDKFLVSRMIG